jgi:hypothetical protein
VKKEKGRGRRLWVGGRGPAVKPDSGVRRRRAERERPFERRASGVQRPGLVGTPMLRGTDGKMHESPYNGGLVS